MGPERALLSIEAWTRRLETGPEKSKFEKVESFAFKKFETFIILCVALAIGAREAAAMSAGQAAETRQILEETRQNRQDSGNSGSGGDSEAAVETRSGMENRPAHDNEVTTEAMTQIADAAPLNCRTICECRRTCGRR